MQPFAELFQGATTLVYKGYQRSLDRFVLLKILRPEFGQDEALARRFEEEARLVAKVQHPNVVAIYAYGQEGQDNYIVAEYVEGIDLGHLIEAGGKLPAELAVFVLLEAARGLQAAHSKDILHRDIKPSNLLISYEGQVKLTDFGMASLASEQDEEVRGTMAYLAPEQVLGQGCSEASDLFALGATFYEMLAGRRAFNGADVPALFDAILHFDPVPLLAADAGLSPVLLGILAKLLAKDPRDRLPDAGALVAQLEAFRATARSRAGAAALKAYVADPEAYRLRADTPGDGAALPVPVAASAWRSAAIDGVPADRRTLLLPVPEGAASLQATPYVLRPTYGRIALVALAVLLVSLLAYAGITRLGTQQRAVTAGAEETYEQEQEAAESLSEEANAEVLPEPEEAAPPPAPAPAQEEQAPVTVAAPPAGGLFVDVQPAAFIFLDEDSVGMAPANLPRLQAGTYEVTLRHPDFPDYRTTVDVQPGERDTLKVVLRNTVGKLAVLVYPWAEVFLDGHYVDQTPLHQILAPGDHRLALFYPPLDTMMVDTTFTIAAGDSLALSFELKLPEPAADPEPPVDADSPVD